MADVVYPSSYNTYVPDHNATNQMVIDYARNINKFAVNKYTQVIPVKKQTGFYLEMTVEEAGRILQTDLRNVLWPDGSPAPEGNDGTESFIFQEYRTDRRAWPVLLGDLTIDQASWNILAQHSSIKARQAMTARTQLAVTALTTATNYDASHRLAITSITGNTGRWDQSTTARQDIKRSLNEGADVIMQDTLSAIDLDDLIVVISPALAKKMSVTQEIVDYLKGSPEALAQVRGELPGSNTMFGLPDKLYGYPIVVEKTVKVTTKKGATTSRSYVMPETTPVMCARPGSLVGVADAPNFSTCCCFALEEMTVETKREDDNRRVIARVVENLVYEIVAKASGILFSSASEE